jgi:hypothetical protein
MASESANDGGMYSDPDGRLPVSFGGAKRTRINRANVPDGQTTHFGMRFMGSSG